MDNRYTEGIAFDGASILDNGAPITISEILKRLNEYDKLVNSNEIIQNVSKRLYSEQDIIEAAKYGYEYRNTTSFPEKTFEENCKNNVKQWIVGVLNTS